ncbi:linear amide C-N hydrolase [Hyphomicrobium sp.]|jgi:choloylglycine hydrolase|uniref:linear amide C-N hydrolase n=1 Tax=Hyphomicrobium sp. TaxID=82 RepID=UPI003569A1CA
MHFRSTARKLLEACLAVSLACSGVTPSFACTSMVFKAQDGAGIYARTMEWGASDLHSQMVLVPRGTKFSSELAVDKTGMTWKTKYGYVGINANGLPFAADGMNEAGLVVGLLYFPGFAEYQKPTDDTTAKTISNVDVANYLLGNFKTVEDVRHVMPTIRVVLNTAILAKFGAPTPMHYIVADGSGASIVIEYTKGNLSIFDNKVGAMTNAPSYDWHVLNLRNYANLKPLGDSPARSINGVSIAPFGAGSGMLGLPGDFTPPSRFIRAVAYVQTMEPVKDAKEGVSAAATMLNNFDIPKGLVREGKSEKDYHLGFTQWSVIGDMRNKVYYYWTMYDRRMRSVDLKKLNFDAKKVTSFPLDRVRTEDIEDRTKDLNP